MTVIFFARDAFICLSGFFMFIVLSKLRKEKLRLPLPPGPTKLPILGDALHFPASFEWETYQAWAKEYNTDILYLNVFGTRIIVLNTLKAATDLLEKRSSIYSGRPKFTLIKKYMGFGWLLPFMGYGTEWKDRRRVFQKYFQLKALTEPWQRQQTAYSRRLLLQLLDAPEQYVEHIRCFVGGTLHSVTYGTTIKKSNDSFDLVDDVMNALKDTAIPMSGIIDMAPWLLPVFSCLLSGPPFNKSQAEWKELAHRFRHEPISDPECLQAQPPYGTSFVSHSLGKLDSCKNKVKEMGLIKDVAAVVYIGGSSTTKALLYTFFLAMLCFPEAQAKAQEELDRVVGQNRLPDFRDEPHLPYLSAIIKEIQRSVIHCCSCQTRGNDPLPIQFPQCKRWQPAGPIGIPHFLEQDDEYGGYHIPGQSIVITNIWAILNDEVEHNNPREFMPERFLKNGQIDPSVRDPASIGFSFGRRVCPGAHIALSIMWISAASILSTFTISKAVDKDGNVVEPTMKYCSGITSQPEPFQCTITPRHHKADTLIRNYVIPLESA